MEAKQQQKPLSREEQAIRLSRQLRDALLDSRCPLGSAPAYFFAPLPDTRPAQLGETLFSGEVDGYRGAVDARGMGVAIPPGTSVTTWLDAGKCAGTVIGGLTPWHDAVALDLPSGRRTLALASLPLGTKLRVVSLPLLAFQEQEAPRAEIEPELATPTEAFSDPSTPLIPEVLPPHRPVLSPHSDLGGMLVTAVALYAFFWLCARGTA